jgi:hypothetical protein
LVAFSVIRLICKYCEATTQKSSTRPGKNIQIPDPVQSDPRVDPIRNHLWSVYKSKSATCRLKRRDTEVNLCKFCSATMLCLQRFVDLSLLSSSAVDLRTMWARHNSAILPRDCMFCPNSSQLGDESDISCLRSAPDPASILVNPALDSINQ